MLQFSGLNTVAKSVAVLTAAFLALMGFVVWQIFVPVDRSSTATTEVQIEGGQSLSGIAVLLEEAQIIRSNFFFVAYAKISGRESDLKAGLYVLSPAMSAHQVLMIISGGLAESDDVVVTVPEGSNVWDIDDILLEAKLIGQRGDFARTQQKNEGYLFPDTYRFELELTEKQYKTDNPDIIAKVMKDNFFAKAGNTIPRDIIITASMLEKEGKETRDFELIAGIINKRMEINMLLQIDATVGYGWCMKRLALRRYTEGCDVTQAPIVSEIAIAGPYNSYMQKGLPAGPISNPGLRAIRAAQNPRESEFYYYLSTRDGSQLIYSKNLAEHLQNRQKYLGL